MYSGMRVKELSFWAAQAHESKHLGDKKKRNGKTCLGDGALDSDVHVGRLMDGA